MTKPDRSAPSAEIDALDRLTRGRHSCRAFLPQPVPRDIITRILEIAQRTASWRNAQPWQVVVTSGEGTERFRAAMYAHAASDAPDESDLQRPRDYRGVYALRRRESGLALYRQLGILKGDTEGSERQAMENFRLFGAPHVAIVTTDDALDTYGAVDCGGYVTSFMLAAQAFGVGTIAQGSLARFSPFVRAHFGLPDDRRMVCGISFGFPDRDHPVNGYRTSRAPLDEAVTWVD
ncbi:MAG: nitroreductase [Alphaproteobacteria bacterium]